jgi:hypothetical protein
MLFIPRTLIGEQSFPILQCCNVLQVCLALASRPSWLVLFILLIVEGKLRLYEKVGGVGLAHLPTLVLPMVGVQLILPNWTEGPIVPLRVRLEFYHTVLPSWLLFSLLFPMKRH